MMHFLWGGSPSGLLFLVPLAIVAAGALYWARSSRSTSGRRRKLRGSELERQILRLAVKKHGVLTVTDVAAETGLSLKEAEKAMGKMVDFSRVSMKVNDSGIVSYEFLELKENTVDKGELPSP